MDSEWQLCGLNAREIGDVAMRTPIKEKLGWSRLSCLSEESRPVQSVGFVPSLSYYLLKGFRRASAVSQQHGETPRRSIPLLLSVCSQWEAHDSNEKQLSLHEWAHSVRPQSFLPYLLQRAQKRRKLTHNFQLTTFDKLYFIFRLLDFSWFLLPSSLSS